MEYFDEQVCNLEYVVKVPALQVELVSLSVYVSRIKHFLNLPDEIFLSGYKRDLSKFEEKRDQNMIINQDFEP